MTSQAADAIREQIRRFGSLSYDDVVESALYGPGGFFTSGGGAGRRADFITSPEVGPLFGALVARFLDTEWDRLGNPEPFFVVEAGAGRGALVKAVLDAQPRCAVVLRYVCVERSSVLRDLIRSAVTVEPPMNLTGDLDHDDDQLVSRDSAKVAERSGPIVSVLDELPALSVVGVVIANELLDNLSFRLFERTEEATWAEVRVSLDQLDDKKLVEVLVEAPSDLAQEVVRLAPDAPIGARLALQSQAASWLQETLGIVERGRVVVIDYGDHSTSMVKRPWRQWLRTYRGHQPGGHPLDDLGNQDITCEVAIDQLDRVRTPSAIKRQADWLKLHGIDELAEEARRLWREGASRGDLAALRARSRVGEAEALTDPQGLGAFWVIEWIIGDSHADEVNAALA